MSSSKVPLEKFQIPLYEIELATDYFSQEHCIGHGEAGVVYKGQLSKCWQNRTAAFQHLYPRGYRGKNDFRNEVEILLRCNHENIIPFIGYCHEGDKMIIATEYAINEILDFHLKDPNKRRCLTWVQRLKICIGVARGLKYLHSGLGDGRTVVHRYIKGSYILLDGNMEAKICVSGRPIIQNYNMGSIGGSTSFYIDPHFYETGILNEQSDLYALGVVLFETLSGMLANQKSQTLPRLIHTCYDDRFKKLIDPSIRSQIDSRSLLIFKEVAYQCISFESKDRPKIDSIIQSIEEALDVQNHGTTSTSTIQVNQDQNPERFLIPLDEINFATSHFGTDNRIEVRGFGTVYKGEVSEHRLKNRTVFFDRLHNSIGEHAFRIQVEMMSTFNHENILTFVGYCDEGNERIIVCAHAINGSLDQYLEDPDKIRHITWAQRLKICIGAARALKYLHSELGEHNLVIHRDVKSRNISLDENMEAKVCCFYLSKLVDRNQPQLYEPAAGTAFYLDPIYNESGILRIELDIYSFGVVLFEVLSGMLASNQRSIGDDQPQTLINLVRRYHDEGLEALIDPHIRDEINIHSFQAFKEIAYRCISLNLKDRPSMNRIIKKIEEALSIQNQGATSTITSNQRQNLENFLIPLKEISLATQDFHAENKIGDGGFGAVYKGQLSEPWQNRSVAIKRLDPKGHQGRYEFLTELKLISSFYHQNIIPFVGYCDDGNEMIIVYEYASNHSLDHHIQDSNKRCCLTWAQRLRICLGTARGLNYLHSGLGEDERVIHRDIKSANILLDENFEAKVCDFGLSKQGPKDKLHTHVFTQAAGTNFYLDPIYLESGILRKESDIYSFGVVLFEILSGMLAYHRRSFRDSIPQPLINIVRRYYNEGLEELIDPFIKDQIDSRCFHTFIKLAYQCISYSSKERPTMDIVIEMIEDAIDLQKRLNKA